MKKLPLSESGFKSIRKENLFYIDKTKQMYDLINFSKYVFLSRPRRFGKSMLLNTLASFYRGEKELFKGLWIEDKVEWQTYPVIHLDFSIIYYHGDKIAFQESFTRVLNGIAEKYQVEFSANANPDYFDELIKKLFKKFQKPIVLLIDEYDKPINAFLTQTEEAVKRRDWLREYYSILKFHTDHIRQIVITGISKFAKTSIFSELNNVKDITINPDFNDIVGFTQKNIETEFDVYLEPFRKKTGWSRERFLEEIALWYDGYSWGGVNKIYNPYSIVNLVNDHYFENFWFKTGTPKMLVDFITQKVEEGALDQDINTYDNFETSKDLLDNTDVENIDIHSLLFQTGYLTIKKYEQIFTEDGIETECIIGFPNKEVRASMTTHLIEAFSKKEKQ